LLICKFDRLNWPTFTVLQFQGLKCPFTRICHISKCFSVISYAFIEMDNFSNQSKSINDINIDLNSLLLQSRRTIDSLNCVQNLRKGLNCYFTNLID
jgi:hypothetical protein